MTAATAWRTAIIAGLMAATLFGAGCAQTQKKNAQSDATHMRAPSETADKTDLAVTPAVNEESLVPQDAHVAAPPAEPAYNDDAPEPTLTAKKKSAKKSAKKSSAKSTQTAAHAHGLPNWLQTKIAGLSRLPAKQRPISVTRWTWKNKTVYLISFTKESKRVSDLYSAKGTLLGHPTGGKSGKGDGKSNDFVKQRKGGTVVWSRK